MSKIWQVPTFSAKGNKTIL